MNAPATMTECPSENALAAFMDGRLEGEERQRVIEHIVECGDCRDIIVAHDELNLEGARCDSDEVPAPIPFRVPMRQVALGAAAIFVVVLSLTPIRQRLFPKPTGIEELAEATASLKERPIQGRVVGNFPYRQRTVMRGPQDEDPNSFLVSGVALKIEEDAGKNPSIDEQHLLGVAYLMLGGNYKKEAVQNLTQALERQTKENDIVRAIHASKDGALLTDLAAAYLDSNNARLAGEAAEASWKLKPTPEAAWNRASAIDSLDDPNRAIAAWRDFLALDSTSGWADEARGKLSLLEQSIAVRSST